MENPEEVTKAIQVLRNHVVRRGDSFDIGEPSNIPVRASEPDIINVLTNPTELSGMLNITQEQAENIRSLIIGTGTGSIHRLLNKYLGDEVSAVLGALVSTWISKKVTGGRY